ncbi:putative mitogen-activated protein kinase kinase kinase STE-STE11 family [Helianthus annuus]|nr:putative mitogen-activated protein kinase kinase kinase STE-STE11 family [Helianthus annuus]
MSKFFSKRRFHISSPANLMPSFTSSSNNSSKSSPCSSSSSPCGNPINVGFYSPQPKKRLTRQRKLRRVSVEYYRAPEDDDGDVSKSLPNSPHLLPQHWSSSAVPQPLPLPNEELRFPAEGYNGGNGRCRSDRTGVNSKSRGVPTSSKTSTYRRRKGYPQDANGEKVRDDIRLDVPARCAPSTTFTSPTLSPKRFSTVQIFDSAIAGIQDFHLSSPSDSSTRRTQLHSPPLQSPYTNSRADSSINNVHPLPLPPPPPSRPGTTRSNLDKSDGQSIKGQWQKGKLLGRGTYGSVYEATNRETGSLCAMKVVDIIPDDPNSSECIRQLEQEIRVLRNLEHQNIVQYLGSEVVEDQFCIYLEYVHPGSINKYVREHCGAMTESVVRNFTRHILSGLVYLHSKKTVHRDIKGANLLVDPSGVVKLADFGLAKHLSPYMTDLSLKGSPHWMAPEVFQAVLRKDANPEHTYTMDIWSLGCTVIEMVTGKPPWSEFDGVQAMFNVLKRSPTIPETLSSEGKDFLYRCLQRNPEKRPSAAFLLEHPFVRPSFDQHLSFCKQEFSGLKLNEIPYIPRVVMQHSPCKWAKHGRLLFHFGTHKHTNSETKRDHSSAAARHSPASSREVVPSEFNFSTQHLGVPTCVPFTGEGRRTYSLPTTPGRENDRL